MLLNLQGPGGVCKALDERRLTYSGAIVAIASVSQLILCGCADSPDGPVMSLTIVMVPHGPTWACHGPHDCHGPTWTHMGQHGPTWASRLSWSHMDPHGPTWASRLSWSHMDPHGPTWALEGLKLTHVCLIGLTGFNCTIIIVSRLSCTPYSADHDLDSLINAVCKDGKATVILKGVQ